MGILVIVILLALQVFSASLINDLISWKRDSLTISGMDVVVLSIGVLSINIRLCVLLVYFFNFI